MNVISKIIEKYKSHLTEKTLHYSKMYHLDLGADGATIHNNEADAFKHCYFQAELTLWLSPVIAEWIGNAHEDRPGNPPGEKAMDLHNNKMGRLLGINIINTPGMWFRPWSYISDIIANYIMVYMGAGMLITKPEEV